MYSRVIAGVGEVLISSAASFALATVSFFAYKKYLDKSPFLSVARQYVNNRELHLRQLAAHEAKTLGPFSLTRRLIVDSQINHVNSLESTWENNLCTEAKNPVTAPVLLKLEEHLKENKVALFVAHDPKLYNKGDEDCAALTITKNSPQMNHLKLQVKDLQYCNAIILMTDQDGLDAGDLIHEAAHYFAYDASFSNEEWLMFYRHITDELNLLRMSLEETRKQLPGQKIDPLQYEKSQLVEHFTIVRFSAYQGYSELQLADEYFARFIEMASNENLGASVIAQLLPQSVSYVSTLMSRFAEKNTTPVSEERLILYR